MNIRHIADSRHYLESFFLAAVRQVNPAEMIQRCLSLQGNTLVAKIDGNSFRYRLDGFDRIMALGFGKAGASMARGLETALGECLSGGIVAVKHGHLFPLGKIRLLEAAHPVPDESSVAAAEALLEAARSAEKCTLVLVLVSGGGSAIACAPLHTGKLSVSLADKATLTSLLLSCGSSINEINTVRRHFSGFKGGRLAEALYPSTSLTLILSDVIGDDINAIASGPTVPDRSSWQDVQDIVIKYKLTGRIPAAAASMLQAGLKGLVPDTPKPGSPVFEKAASLIIGSNRLALAAAMAAAQKAGFETEDIGSELCGDVRVMADRLLKLALKKAKDRRSAEAKHPADGNQGARPLCIIGGGETTVNLSGKGKGGRNQEMALAFLDGLSRADRSLADRISFLSAGTDGSDGPTDAAGAFADLELARRAGQSGLDTAAFLSGNDAYHYFDAIGGLLRTGPTNTNVCDIQIIIIR